MFELGESTAKTERGEGVYIESSKKLAITGSLCTCRNFRPGVGTSNQLKKFWQRGCCRESNGTSDMGGRNFRP